MLDTVIVASYPVPISILTSVWRVVGIETGTGYEAAVNTGDTSVNNSFQGMPCCSLVPGRRTAQGRREGGRWPDTLVPAKTQGQHGMDHLRPHTEG